jgi:hypothetical protein
MLGRQIHEVFRVPLHAEYWLPPGALNRLCDAIEVPTHYPKPVTGIADRLMMQAVDAQ